MLLAGNIFGTFRACNLYNLSNSPTLSNVATQQGVIVGTTAYMSPDQARAREVNKRTDIWAFGCVLYEMLTGQAVFRGEDLSEWRCSRCSFRGNCASF